MERVGAAHPTRRICGQAMGWDRAVVGVKNAALLGSLRGSQVGRFLGLSGQPGVPEGLGSLTRTVCSAPGPPATDTGPHGLPRGLRMTQELRPACTLQCFYAQGIALFLGNCSYLPTRSPWPGLYSCPPDPGHVSRMGWTLNPDGANVAESGPGRHQATSAKEWRGSPPGPGLGESQEVGLLKWQHRAVSCMRHGKVRVCRPGS